MNESPVGSVMDVTIEEPVVDDDENGSKIFQKDNWRFKFLPYYTELIREADKEFCIVKTALAQSILERDLRPGFTLAIKNLISYIANYGRRFTKPDHIHIVELLYNVLILKGLDFRVIKMVSCGLNSLLNRKMLITRDDLRVKWLPLYNLYKEVAFKKLEEDGLILFPENLKENLEATITYLSDFFEESATQDILDLVRPNICPFDDIISQTVVTATLFLPTVLKPEEHEQFGAKLWFDELYHWYSSGEFSVDNEDRLLSLFAQLSSDCPFYIDWTDKLDVLMDRLMQCCNLSVSGTQLGVNATSVSLIATLLACNLGGRDNIVQEKLTKVFEAWEDFFHPSNSGTHLSQLISFVSKLVTTVASRISRERFFPKKHYVQIPEDRKITDQQLDIFVKSLLPCLNYAAFAKTKQDVPRIFRYCAFLAPGIILPPLLDLIYPALENITEPHRLQQTLNIFMQILVPLARDEPTPGRERLNLKLLDDGTVNDKSLRSHFITILNNILPGVDVNDVTKSALTFHIITTIFCLMPVVDCSDALHIRDDLTDEERELCSATAGFESLIEQILQKCFSIIEANSSGYHGGNIRPFSMEQVQKTTEELYNERGIYAVIRQLTKNCSSAIYEYAMNLFFEFIKDRVFDARTAVDSVCLIMNIFITAKPKVAFPKFFNYAWTKLQSLLSPSTHEEEELNHGILFFYTLTCESFNRLRGDVILENKDVIFPVLDTLLQFKCRDAYLRASSALENTMRMLVSIYPDMDEHYMAINDQPLEKYLPIRNWAKIVKKNDWVMKWHVPSNEEVDLADALLQKYLFGALQCLETPERLADKEMVKYLQIVQNSVFGAASLLPFFDGTPVTKFPNGKIPPFLPCVAMSDQVRRITAPDGTNMRRCVYFKIKKLTHYILEHKKNDIKSLRVVINILRDLLLCEGMDLMSYIYKASNHVIRKRAFNDPIRGQIMAVEMALEEAIYFIHQKRMFSRPLASFTDIHVDSLSLLVTLGTSMYADTRHKAQQILELCLSHVPYSYKFILDQVLNIIQNQRNVSHEEFKGALYILINGKKTSISLKQDWETLLKVWPALLQAQLSEKPSIIALFDFIIQCIAESFESFYISYTLPDHVMPSARNLLVDYETNYHKPLLQLPYSKESEAARLVETNVNQRNMENYYALCHSLHSICLDPNLHWRHIDMAQSLIALMFRRDVPVPDEIIRLFMRLLIHDTLRTRKSALTVITSWQKIMKIRSVKVSCEIPVKVENVGPGARWPIKYGLRKDNAELIYAMNRKIETPEEYNNTCFFTKWHTGFYTWPAEFKVLAPPNQQIAGNRTDAELSDVERDVLSILSEPGFMDKLIAFFALEEKKGSDVFVEMNYQLFYRFLRNLGPVVWPLLAPHLDRLIASKKEGEQRLAAEIVSGLLLATKLWKYEQALPVVTWLQPRLLKCLETMTDEAETNWCTSLANVFCRMDMRQISWLYSMIFDLVRRSQDSGFHATFRLRLLHSCVVQHEWRVTHLLRDLFRHCATLVARNSQFLRGRVGAALASCTLHNVFGMYIDPEIPPEYRPMTNADMVAVINREISESIWKDVLIGGFDQLPLIWQTEFTDSIPRLPFDGCSSSDSPPPSVSRSTSIEPAENGEVVDSSPAGPITTRASSSKGAKQIKSHLRRASTPPVSIVKLVGKVPDMGRKREKAMVITLANSVYSSWSLSSAAQLFPSFELFPLFAYCANDPIDDELSSTCEELVISEMACSPVKPDLADHVLRIVRLTVFNSCSWKTICTTIRFLQVHIFANFYVYKSGFIDRIREILDRLMMDSQLEVRVQAGATLSGFIQSGLLAVDDDFLNTFVEWSKSTDLTRRHAGVLALSAVVTAAPYKVPPYMPDVLMLICQHLRDPQPIYPTVKKTLNEFRRTHLDCWQDHKNQFNDNQLTVLTNLLVSPNYYV